ncbi:MAG TPA: HesA/MoeB/ThiF family protein [Desulfobacteraceae bacterium]|nr:HesA/MoeB/ThiF family protein [Desulfobacteraceae bacterium]HPJ67119.1 HesA/MoeB/ThiF family protein [Desulfobacteraceae bacterium]HPQ28354.1 HesA/MoeB/ThiF family protein [Desulfobacteraceae bacterium]
MLTKRERERYDRQILIPEIGMKGQERLKKAKVLIAGSGGLGSPVSFYLAAAGIGTIRIVDYDVVDISNLNRQILHWDGDIGRKKVDSAFDKLSRLNPSINIDTVNDRIDKDNLSKVVEGCDMIVDAMDNFQTRYLLNRVAIKRKIPFFYGAVRGFEGRAMTVIPDKTACLMCMYKGPVPEEKSPVMGVAPAVIGAIQATEVIKYITGVGQLLENRILHFDGLDMTFKEFKINRNPQCIHCGNIERKE